MPKKPSWEKTLDVITIAIYKSKDLRDNSDFDRQKSSSPAKYLSSTIQKWVAEQWKQHSGSISTLFPTHNEKPTSDKFAEDTKNHLFLSCRKYHYLYDGKQFDDFARGITKEPSDRDRFLIAFHLVLWASMDRNSRLTVVNFINCLYGFFPDNKEKSSIFWECLWCVYKCTSMMAWYSFVTTVKDGRIKDEMPDDFKSIELLFVSKMLHPVCSIITGLLPALASEPIYNPVTETLNGWGIFRFLTSSLVCYKNERIRESMNEHETNRKDEDFMKIINEETNWNGLFSVNELSMVYFCNFLSRFGWDPLSMEHRVIRAIYTRKTAPKSYVNLAKILTRIDNFHQDQQYAEKTTLSGKHADEESEDDARMEDKPQQYCKFIDYEATEAEGKDSEADDDADHVDFGVGGGGGFDEVEAGDRDGMKKPEEANDDSGVQKTTNKRNTIQEIESVHGFVSFLNPQSMHMRQQRLNSALPGARKASFLNPTTGGSNVTPEVEAGDRERMKKPDEANAFLNPTTGGLNVLNLEGATFEPPVANDHGETNKMEVNVADFQGILHDDSDSNKGTQTTDPKPRKNDDLQPPKNENQKKLSSKKQSVNNSETSSQKERLNQMITNLPLFGVHQKTGKNSTDRPPKKRFAPNFGAQQKIVGKNSTADASQKRTGKSPSRSSPRKPRSDASQKCTGKSPSRSSPSKPRSTEQTDKELYSAGLTFPSASNSKRKEINYAKKNASTPHKPIYDGKKRRR